MQIFSPGKRSQLQKSDKYLVRGRGKTALVSHFPRHAQCSSLGGFFFKVHTRGLVFEGFYFKHIVLADGNVGIHSTTTRLIS